MNEQYEPVSKADIVAERVQKAKSTLPYILGGAVAAAIGVPLSRNIGSAVYKHIPTVATEGKNVFRASLDKVKALMEGVGKTDILGVAKRTVLEPIEVARSLRATTHMMDQVRDTGQAIQMTPEQVKSMYKAFRYAPGNWMLPREMPTQSVMKDAVKNYVIRNQASKGKWWNRLLRRRVAPEVTPAEKDVKTVVEGIYPIWRDGILTPEMEQRARVVSKEIRNNILGEQLGIMGLGGLGGLALYNATHKKQAAMSIDPIESPQQPQQVLKIIYRKERERKDRRLFNADTGKGALWGMGTFGALQSRLGGDLADAEGAFKRYNALGKNIKRHAIAGTAIGGLIGLGTTWGLKNKDLLTRSHEKKGEFSDTIKISGAVFSPPEKPDPPALPKPKKLTQDKVVKMTSIPDQSAYARQSKGT